MGYDISLVGEYGDVVQVDRHKEGGTYLMDGNTNAEISITYNYSKFFYDTIDAEHGIRWIYGRRLSEIKEVLERAITILGVYKDEDYWVGTPGNAGHILEILLKWADANPNAMFTGD